MTPQALKRSRGKVAPTWPDGTSAPFALDNGAWSAFVKGKPFDAHAYRWAIGRIGAQAAWTVIPDVVGDAAATLSLADQWWPELLHLPLMLAVQDGMEGSLPKIKQWLDRGLTGLFVGGSTEWKIRTIPLWCSLAQASGALCHVARVNSVRRLKLCLDSGAHSIDGSSPSRWPGKAELLSDCVNRYACARSKGTVESPTP